MYRKDLPEEILLDAIFGTSDAEVEERKVAQIKIREGTPRHDGSSLCYSCKKAQIVQGQNLQEEIIECDDLYSDGGQNRIRFKVTACNKYLNANHPTIREMESIAWILRTDDKKKNSIGFVPARDIKDYSERHVLPDDD